MQKLWVSLCVGQNQGVGGGAQWLGGYLEMYTSGSNTQMAVCRQWGVYVCMYRNVRSDRGTK